MQLSELVAAALAEDLGPGDLTTEACVPVDVSGRGSILAKNEGLVVCGHAAAREVFRQVGARYGAEITYTELVADGTAVADRTVVATVEGSLRAIIIGERLALNLMMKLSGIATHVQSWVAAARDTSLRVVDTRKTTPLLRALEKYAVRCGGGHNHRMGLYDGVMIKDNHIAAVGGIAEAVQRVRERVHHLVRIEVEVTNLGELDQALAAGADVILLDNMDDAMLGAAVERTRAVRPRVVLEASGNMDAERIGRIRGLGLDVVSAGGLIHQATWVDLSLDLHG